MHLKVRGAYEWANIGGVTYTLFLIFGIYSLILFFTCPWTYHADQCARAHRLGIFIVVEILINFTLFLVYSRYPNFRLSLNFFKNSTFSGKGERRGDNTK